MDLMELIVLFGNNSEQNCLGSSFWFSNVTFLEWNFFYSISWNAKRNKYLGFWASNKWINLFEAEMAMMHIWQLISDKKYFIANKIFSMSMAVGGRKFFRIAYWQSLWPNQTWLNFIFLLEERNMNYIIFC